MVDHCLWLTYNWFVGVWRKGAIDTFTLEWEEV